MIGAKFGWNWPSGSGEEDGNVKNLQTDGWTDGEQLEKLTWAFSLSELKINGIKKEKTKLQHSCLVCVKLVSINPNVIKTSECFLPALCEASILMFDWCTLELPQHWQHIFLPKGSADLVWIMCDWSASFLWQHKMASETVQWFLYSYTQSLELVQSSLKNSKN